METIREELDRLHADIADLRAQTDKNFKELRTYIDQSVRELRDHIDLSVKELREHVDQSDKDLRTYIDHGLEVVRKEASTNLRWVVGLCLGNTALILGLYGKLFDLY